MTVTIAQADTLYPSDNSYADHVVRPNYWGPVVLPPDDVCTESGEAWYRLIARGMGGHDTPSDLCAGLRHEDYYNDRANKYGNNPVVMRNGVNMGYVALPQSLEHQMNAERKWYSEDPSYTLDWTCTLRMNKQSKYHIPVPTPVYDWVQS